MTEDQQLIVNNFRGERYEYLNNLRWEIFLKMGIPLEDKVIFEPGAGIGDQTEWLLNQGAKHIYVNDGRPENLEIIRERFLNDNRVTCVDGDLEKLEDIDVSAGLVFLWGVYYHIDDSFEDFRILRNLSQIAPLIVMEYLESSRDMTEGYNYDNPSTSVSRRGIRPTSRTMIEAIKSIWRNAYLPKIQMDWEDPYAQGFMRRIVVGSWNPMDNPNLELQ